MQKRSSIHRIQWLAGLLLAAALLSGCSPNSPIGALLPAPETSPTPAVTPTGTPDDYGFPYVLSPYCYAGGWNTIQTEGPQGDLMAWSPAEDRLAWIEPGKTGNWSAGNIVISSGAEMEERIVPNMDALAFGNLTWSKDGQMLAFVALRRSDSLYTVMTVDLRGERPKVKDRLPDEAARTDDWGSDKAIVGWSDDLTLEVISSCGPDCDMPITIDLEAGTWQANPTAQRKSLQEYWKVSNQRLVDDPEQYPPMVEPPSWSQDGEFMAYIDERDNLWVVSLPEKTQTQIRQYLGYVQEVKWTWNSRQMAVRNESRIMLFSMDCPE